MKPKIIVYGDVEWSVGNVHKSIAKYLNNDFEFCFYEWRNYTPEYIIDILNDHDVVLANYASCQSFAAITSSFLLKKFVFITHGYPDIISYNYDKPVLKENFPPEAIYTITSMSIASLFPKEIKLYPTFNGVEMNDFICKKYTNENGILKKIGWCGEPKIASKRTNLALEIATKTDLLLSFAVKLSFIELQKWYHTIDILIITAGPEQWAETGPLPAFEAIASGTLVIGTRVGNFNQIPGPKFDTVEEAVSIINELKNNPEKQKQIIQEQYDCVKNNWSYEKIHLQWKEVFLEVIKKNKVITI